MRYTPQLELPFFPLGSLNAFSSIQSPQLLSRSYPLHRLLPSPPFLWLVISLIFSTMAKSKEEGEEKGEENRRDKEHVYKPEIPSQTKIVVVSSSLSWCLWVYHRYGRLDMPHGSKVFVYETKEWCPDQ